MKILAYADRISVRAGESLELKVSCDGIPCYQAELVRVVQGDINPDGPGYCEEVIPVDLGGPFEGRHQALRTGSFAIVEDRNEFAALTSFCVTVSLWPTVPEQACQTLVARRNSTTGDGFDLHVDERGEIRLELSSDSRIALSVSSGRVLQSHRWYDVCAGYDADHGILSVRQVLRSPHASENGNAGNATTRRIVCELSQAGVDAPLTIAGRTSNNGHADRCYNGRLEQPRLFALSPDVLEELATTVVDAALVADPRCIAAWDFAIDIPTDRIVDVSGNGADGQLVNLPARAVTGTAWDGSELNWQQRPEHYAAIHFHDDDLSDARWQTDFIVSVPADLPSAVYAIRLHAGDQEFYVPFCVRPHAGTPRADVAFLVPTASYIAYANNRIGIDVPETELVCGQLLQLTPQDIFMQEHPELGLSFYDLHADGSGVYYSSRLRPIVNLQPKFIGKLGGRGSNVWQFNADTHVTGWLEHIGQEFDVLTDEDLHAEGSASLADYKVIVTGTHPEYYTKDMLDALEQYTHQRGRLMYLGGNGFYWRVSCQDGRPGVLECRKSENGIRAFPPGPGEYYASLTGEYTGLWRANGRPPNALVGVGMTAQGFDVSSPYRRSEASRDPAVAFVFDGVQSDVFGDFGLSGGGAAGLELDRADPDLGTPANAIVLASSERHTDLYLVTPEDMLDPVPGLGGTEADTVRSDLVLMRVGDDGAVFSTGSIAWAGSIAWNGYDNDIATITGNVLRRFLASDYAVSCSARSDA